MLPICYSLTFPYILEKKKRGCVAYDLCIDIQIFATLSLTRNAAPANGLGEKKREKNYFLTSRLIIVQKNTYIIFLVSLITNLIMNLKFRNSKYRIHDGHLYKYENFKIISTHKYNNFFFARGGNIFTSSGNSDLTRPERPRSPNSGRGEDAPQPILRGVPDLTPGATTRNGVRHRLPTKNPPLRLRRP